MRVAILAGGMGTRLRERSGDMPKPMVPVLGKPVLQHQIELCRKHGFTDIALLVQHRHEIISEYFGDGSALGVKVKYGVEDEPRGTAGALRDALPMLADRFLLLYGDTFMDVDLRKLWMAHESSGAVGTLFLHPNDHPQDSDLVDIDEAGVVRAILPYPHPAGREVRSRCRRLVLIGGLARAGKSYAAQVFKELLHTLGRKAHVISLDGWLKANSERREGSGVRERYDLAAASAAIANVVGSSSRIVLYEPLYDRLAPNADKQRFEHSVGPNDVLIVEGVPALLMDDLLGLSGVMKVYVDVARDTREIRLNQDYAWRGILADEQFATLASRELDEVPIVEESRMLADFVIGQEFEGKKE